MVGPVGEFTLRALALRGTRGPRLRLGCSARARRGAPAPRAEACALAPPGRAGGSPPLREGPSGSDARLRLEAPQKFVDSH